MREVRDALANGADVNERGLIKLKNGENLKWTVLMEAVDNNDEALVSLLLKQPGIEVNAQDKYGWTALHQAALKDNRNVVKVLLNFPGIDIDVTDDNGLLPQEVAMVEGSDIFIEECLKKMGGENDEYKKKMEVEIKKLKNTKSATNQETNKRKRETTGVSLKQKNMWKKLKTVQNRQKAALKELLMKKKENEEELVEMEEKMVEELDKKYRDKREVLMREEQKERSEIAEKVKVTKERQAQVHQALLDKLEKEQRAKEAEVVAEMWKQLEEEE